MSRRKGRSTTPSSLNSSQHNRVPAVPAETVAFLQRSLERNDVELAAVDKLNHQLRTLRDKLPETLRLDLGVGKIRLAETPITCVKKKDDKNKTTAVPVTPLDESTDNNAPTSCIPTPQLAETPEAAALTAAQQASCIDFLQRLRLRRKLLNRLFRRLLRVAATMDTTDATTRVSVEDPSKPPPLPRYGEDRLQVDLQAADKMYQRIQRQCEAWEHKLQNNGTEQDNAAFLEYKEMYTRVRAEAEVYYLASAAAANDDDNNNAATDNHNKNQAPWSGHKIAALQRNLSAKEREAEYQRWKTALWGRIPLQPTFDEIQPAVFLYEQRVVAAAKQQEEEEDAVKQEKEQDAVEGEEQAVKEKDASMTDKEETPVTEGAKTTDPSHDACETDKDKPASEHADPPVKEETKADEMEVEQSQDDKETTEADDAPEATSQGDSEQVKPKKSEETTPSQEKEDTEKTKESNQAKDEESDKAAEDTKGEKETNAEEEDPREEADIITKEVKDDAEKNEAEDAAEKKGDEDAMDIDKEGNEEFMQVEKEGVKDEEMKDAETEEAKKDESSDDEKDDDSEESDDDKDGDSAEKKSADARKSEEEEDSEDDYNSEESSEGKKEDESEDGAGDKRADKEDKKDDDDDEEEDKRQTRAKIVRPISLIPVPSFYEQDMKRIKIVHADMMSVSMQDFARRRTQEVVAEYNKALRRSNDLNERRSRIQSQLHSLISDNRTFVSQVSKNYRAEYEAAYKQWDHRRQEFESARLNLYMPHRNNPHHRPNGTALTKVYAGQPDPTRRAVAFCLGDVLDTVIGAAEGQYRLERFTDEFRPPPKPDVQSNTNYAQNQKTEERLKKEYSVITSELRSSEEERQKCWKRMMKTKAEFEVPHGRTSIDMSNYALMPLPSLRQSGGESVPMNAVPSVSLPMDAKAVSRLPPTAAVTVASVGNPMPSRPPNPTMPSASAAAPSSDSKYSAARVRERISSDGTVAPVTAPKRTKEGLYVRPAGRTRKGMEWDAVRGIWVPEPQQPQGPSW